MKAKLKRYLGFMMLAQLCLLNCGEDVLAEDYNLRDLFKLDLVELMKVTVQTASRSDESLQNAPATVLVLTAKDLRDRGYRDLSQMYNDLPGMDVARPYGDVYFRNYWRGLRNNVGSPYLVMVDGLTLNDLYYNEDDQLAALPISDIERVEIVYGPASVVYGPNAFVGVINVLTRHDKQARGLQASVQVRNGSFETQTADATLSLQNEDWRFRLTARRDYGVLDDSQANDYEWTKQHYYADRSLWGDYLSIDHYGSFNSPHDHRAQDIRLAYKNTELIASNTELRNGYGTEYPADVAQNYAYWREYDQSYALHHEEQLAYSVHNTTLLRYRRTGIGTGSDFLEGYNYDLNGDGAAERVVDFSYWEVNNVSMTFNDDLGFNISDALQVSSGIHLEKKTLQKASRANYSATLPPAEVDLSTLEFPPQHTPDPTPNNTIDWTDKGIYLLSRYLIGNDSGEHLSQVLNAGLRFDHNSEYGPARTLRAAYGLHKNAWSWKMQYGTSFQEPPPRTLYSGWRGAGSDPDLQAEHAHTLESSIAFTTEKFSVLADAYHLQTDNAIVLLAGGASDLGQRKVDGLDLHFQARFGVQMPTALWTYYSFTQSRQQRNENSSSQLYFDDTGDIAQHALHVGANVKFLDNLSGNLRGRWFSERRTVSTNPLEHVPAYSVWDLNLSWQLTTSYPLTLQIGLTNVFDTHYVEPGVRRADAGDTPGFYDNQGLWAGSEGYFNSALPQEGRGLFLSVYYNDW